MANPLGIYLRKKLLAKGRNLVSLDDHYRVMARLLRHAEITGILDAGASHGRVARRLLRYFPAAKVYAFEPHPDYAETLRAQAERQPRLVPQFYGLAEHRGRAELQITASPGTTSLYRPVERLRSQFPEATEILGTKTIDTVSIDQWLAEKNDASLTLQLMKLDIQGGELGALKGAERTLRSSVLLVYTEVLFNRLYDGGALFGEIDLYLHDSGFDLYDLFQPRYDDRGMLMWGNAIYLRRER